MDAQVLECDWWMGEGRRPRNKHFTLISMDKYFNGTFIYPIIVILRIVPRLRITPESFIINNKNSGSNNDKV